MRSFGRGAPSFGLGLIALMSVVLIALFLCAWFIPSAPALADGITGTGFSGGYVDNHYSVWSKQLGPRRPFVATNEQVVVHGAGCQGTVRLVGPPVEGGYLAAVSVGALPGASVIGRRLTPQSDLAIVLTSSSSGRCEATAVGMAAHSWWRTGWSTIPVDFYVDVTHKIGTDSRVKLASVPPL